MYLIKNLHTQKLLNNIDDEQENIIKNLDKIKKYINQNIKISNQNTELKENFDEIIKSCKNLKNFGKINNLNYTEEEKFFKQKINDFLSENEFNNTINSINFDSTNYEKNVLCLITLEIFKTTFDLESIGIEEQKLKLFIFEVNKYYKNNPFHNFEHAVSVLQFTYLLISKIEINKYLSKYRLFGLMIAALVHDIDHPGHTNMFEIKKKTELSQMYNDNSVLENHHCSTAFYILSHPEIQLLKNLTIDEFKIVRETIIDSIISTDMKYHFELVKDLENTELNFENKANEMLFCKMIIHVADLSNQLRNFKIAYYMCQGLRKEFISQVENEKKLNLSSQQHMEKLENDDDFYQCEIDFCSNIIKPLIKIFCKHFTYFKYILRNLKINMEKWKKLLMHEVLKDKLFNDDDFIENYNYSDDDSFKQH